MIKWLIQETDTDDQRYRKKITGYLVPFALAIGGTLAFGITKRVDIMNVSCCFLVLVLTVASVKWIVTKKQTDFDIIAVLTASIISILAADLVSATIGATVAWPITVLVFDCALLIEINPRVSSCLVVLVVCYLLVRTTEEMTRFGLFDITGAEKMERWSCIQFTEEELQASPCKLEALPAIRTAAISFGVLLLDFYCTRKFAYGMQSERQKLAASVSLAERVVSALVRFDLEEAEQNINSVDTTPLTEVLSQLLHNLHQYRPYLPDSLFELSDEGTTNFDAPTAEAPQNLAAIVFTDLKSSTAIWEASPDAMKRALKMHDTLIRNCISNFGGYEVKTIGDSFMVAFSTFESGCEFAMSVQDRMLSATWPFDLRLPTEFEEHGWNGLMVRIGLHFGEVTTETNPVSGREDYFGRTVNKAARLERACVPGGVAIDAEMLSEISLNDDWNHRTINEHLKGIDDNPVAIEILTKDKFAFSASRLDLEKMSSGMLSTSLSWTSFREREACISVREASLAVILQSEQLLMKSESRSVREGGNSGSAIRDGVRTVHQHVQLVVSGQL
eukprot:TRINITY_DN3065_c0_g1_i7.p1 TRINITY_DN3065_c0_g1~~TRINITY_DN3065_c0_g1_i7.p1  ORF type:complete len:561 (+),score=107.09 TRINITY_DN3065_c0_g1_i7:255-1937(+)